MESLEKPGLLALWGIAPPGARTDGMLSLLKRQKAPAHVGVFCVKITKIRGAPFSRRKTANFGGIFRTGNRLNGMLIGCGTIPLISTTESDDLENGLLSKDNTIESGSFLKSKKAATLAFSVLKKVNSRKIV